MKMCIEGMKLRRRLIFLWEIENVVDEVSDVLVRGRVALATTLVALDVRIVNKISNRGLVQNQPPLIESKLVKELGNKEANVPVIVRGWMVVQLALMGEQWECYLMFFRSKGGYS